MWLSTEGDQQVPSIPVIVHEMICLCTNLQVSVFFSVEINFTVSFYYLYLYITAYHGKKEIMNSNKEICGVSKVYSFNVT